jgi:hypothetical protein
MANKMTIYIMVIIGIDLLFYYTGLLEGTGTSALLDLVMNPTSITSQPFWVIVKVAIAAIATAGIFIGALMYNRVDLVAIGAMIIPLFNILWDITKVFTKLTSINPDYTPFIILIFSPILFLLIITVVEFWRGIES